MKVTIKAKMTRETSQGDTYFLEAEGKGRTVMTLPVSYSEWEYVRVGEVVEVDISVSYPE